MIGIITFDVEIGCFNDNAVSNNERAISRSPSIYKGDITFNESGVLNLKLNGYGNTLRSGS
ncbi:MAG: hypothetical protein ACTSVI_05185 [Promethearchaeota archaeon]